ncbi:Na+/H+ antiporter NhaC family protein [Alkaliphilus flagellatus]|uniref:Na+/H+ antiporter NhaC family protein n=1 Tax=Alkaliphilus flagellatus TaxID=2841507 RepID=UPI001FE4CF00|nr:Na+/H+ antiporter NhaC family protein [Alkaliphilus flagellatus]
MIKTKWIMIILCIIILGLFFVAPNNTLEHEGHFGWVSIIPPLLAILLAFITKQVLLSLFFGVFIGATILNGWNPMIGFFRTMDQFIVGALSDKWNAGTLIFTFCIGGMIGVVNKIGGTRAIAESLAKRATTARSAQIITWLMGMLIFFDDYSNTLIVGSTMQPLTDRVKVSREKLSYIVDSTAAPITGIALLSTWIGYELGLIKDAYTSLGMNVNSYEIFIQTIPYRFYCIYALIFVIIIAALNKDYGPMYKAEQRARLTGKVFSDEAKVMKNSEVSKIDLNKNVKYKAYNAIIPILTLIVVSFFAIWYSGYSFSEANISPFSLEGIRISFGNADVSIALMWSSVVASIIAILMGISQKILNLAESFDAWIEGSKSMLASCMVLVLAWSLGSITSSIGTADFLVGIVSDKFPTGLIPVIIFTISCIVSFATGTSWGTMAILIPMALPIANSFVLNGTADPSLILVTLGSVLTGSIFGDHCSPISDTTIMSSLSSGSDHIEHVKTQMPYALTVAFVTLISYVLVGILRLNPIFTIVVGICLLICIVQILGKNPEKDVLFKNEP